MLYAEPVHENMWKQEEEVIVCSDEPLSPFAKAESLAEGRASCQPTSSMTLPFLSSHNGGAIGMCLTLTQV